VVLAKVDFVENNFTNKRNALISFEEKEMKLISVKVMNPENRFNYGGWFWMVSKKIAIATLWNI